MANIYEPSENNQSGIRSGKTVKYLDYSCRKTNFLHNKFIRTRNRESYYISAEKFSDIESTSDSEHHKKARHDRAKKVPRDSSASEDEECDDKSNWRNKTARLPLPPKIPSNFSSHKATPLSRHDFDKVSSKPTMTSKQNSSTTTVSSHSTLEDHELTKQVHRLLSTYSTDVELKKEILRKLNQMNIKLDSIDERLRIIEERGCGENDRNMQLHLDDIISLPLKSQEDFELLENDLVDRDFYKRMVLFLHKIGGKDCHDLTFNILKRTITNPVAILYSWAGTKTKKSFKDYLVCKCIMQSIRYENNYTEKEIIELIFLSGSYKRS